MLMLKLLFVVIGSCIAYRTSELNNYKLTSEPLSPFEDKDEARIAPQDILHTNAADSDDLQLFNKHKRAVLKNILNGILLKGPMGTKGRLVKGASGIHSSRLKSPETNTALSNVISRNDNLNHVSKTNQPALCPSPSNFDKNVVSSNVQTESFPSKNEATIKPCLAYSGSLTNNLTPLHSILRQKFQHNIPLTSTTNSELPSAHLNPSVTQKYRIPTKILTDIPESHSFVPLNTPKYSEDSIRQQNTPQVKECDLLNSESNALNYEEIKEPTPIIIPEPPAYFPLNSPEVFGSLFTNNNKQNVYLDSNVEYNVDSDIHHSSSDNILIEKDIYNDFRDNSDLSNLPCLQTQHEESIDNTPISVPEAPALLPLNPPSVSFNPIYSSLNDEVNKDITSIDSANLELSDTIPCFQSSTPNIAIADDVSSDISETLTLPSNLPSSNIEIPDAPAYIPLNPPDSSPVYDLTQEDISNIESGNSELSDPSCSQNTVKPTENVLYIIPEPPALLPLNPPDVSLYPTYFNNEGNKEESGFDLANADLAEVAYYPSSYTPPAEDIPSIVLGTVAPTLSDSVDTTIIPDPPAYIPLNPEVTYISVPEDQNINYDISNDSKIPCPQQSLVVESTENTPIIYNEEITHEPVVLENPSSNSIAIIPDPPSYIPLNPPDTTYNFVIDKDTYISSNDHDHIPCSQSHVPVAELSYNLPLDVTEVTKSVVIPNPPSYIPLNRLQIESANKIQKEIPNVVSGEQELKDEPLSANLPVVSQPKEFNSLSLNEPNPTTKPEQITQFPDISNNNVLYVCSDDSGGLTHIPCPQSSRIESSQSIPVSLPEAPINSPIHLSFSIKQQISLPNILPGSNISPSEQETEKGEHYKAQKSTIDTSSSNAALVKDTASEHTEKPVTNNFNPTIAITDKQTQGSVSQVVTTLSQDYVLNKEANTKILELPPCAPEAPVDGIITNFFESKKCKSDKQESTLTFEKFSKPAQHLRRRKVWINKSLTPEDESSQPLLVKKTKKFRILRKQN